jgi:predicted RNA-binding protein with PIN domain
VPGLEVVYSPGHLTADALIEREVYNAETRRHLVVVSGDRSLRDLCRGLGALVMNPDNFLVTVRESVGQARQSLQQSHQAHRPLRIEDRLSDETLRYLRNLKDKLEG